MPSLEPADRPVLIYDGDCGFCRRWVERWKRAVGEQVEMISFQDPSVATRFPTVPREAFERAVHLIEPEGAIYRGAAAVFRTLCFSRSHRGWFWAYQHVPGFKPLSEWLYRVVARHRSFLSRLEKFFGPGSAEQIQVRSGFLRGLGLIYFFSFVSLWPQLLGLAGPHGILPVEQLIDFARSEVKGWQHFFQLPTLCWISSSNLSLQLQCGAGIFFSALLMLGWAPVLATSALWAFYLSLTIACGAFLEFQWDNLLLESGLLAIFYSPLQWRLSGRSPPSAIVVWLWRWLVFRFMLQSGLVKLLSGDESWRHFRALDFHFQTQPLPSWIGWYAHQLPHWSHAFSVLAMFVIELVLPFFIFLGQYGRVIAAAGFFSLQLFIGLTGNYGFFNLLTVLLSFTLLDDALLARAQRLWRGRRPFRRTSTAATEPAFEIAQPRAPRRWPVWIPTVVAFGVLLLSMIQWTAMFRVVAILPNIAIRFYAWTAPFRSVNSYGLFAVMTTNRAEIVIEGSMDGEHWVPYEFKYKPGDVKRRPDFTAPHMPRLDWQMWFAALGSYRENRWFLQFCWRLLNGAPEVTGLLPKNPFPQPPRYLRALKYEYRFTGWNERRRTGEWWRRKLIGYYCPVLKLPETPPAPGRPTLR